MRTPLLHTGRIYTVPAMLSWRKLDRDISGRRYTGWFHILTGIEKYDRNCNYKDFGIGWLLLTPSIHWRGIMTTCLPAMQETWVRSLGWEDPLVKEMAPHSNTLARKIPWMEEPGRLQSVGSPRAGHDWATSLHFNDNLRMINYQFKAEHKN